MKCTCGRRLLTDPLRCVYCRKAPDACKCEDLSLEPVQTDAEEVH